MKRSRSNDGHITRISKTIPVSESLVIAVLGDELNKKPERRDPLPATAFSGPKLRKSGAATKDPDWAILHARWLREFKGLGIKEISEQMASIGVDMDRGRVDKICDYATRAHLVPENIPDGYIPVDTK